LSSSAELARASGGLSLIFSQLGLFLEQGYRTLGKTELCYVAIIASSGIADKGQDARARYPATKETGLLTKTRFLEPANGML
jgi:hypothetical protein